MRVKGVQVNFAILKSKLLQTEKSYAQKMLIFDEIEKLSTLVFINQTLQITWQVLSLIIIKSEVEYTKTLP